MRPFAYEQPPLRIVFAAGAFDRVAEEIRRLACGPPLIICSPGRRPFAEALSRRLGADTAGIVGHAVAHVPIDAVRAARDIATRAGAGCSVAIGGGSAIGLAKALSLETGQPIVAVPTTYAGSEMTSIYGITDQGMKKTGRDHRVLPKTVIYDPALTLTLPPHVSGPSGLNAIAHCVEALYAPDRSPVTSLMAAEGIRRLAESLPVIVNDPADLERRSEALYGACLAGAALGATSMSLHHKLCHTLGGAFNLPHAGVHAVMLPQAIAFNRDAAPEAMRAIAQALGAADAAQGIFDLAVRIGAPVSLAQIGMPAGGLDRAARLAVESPYDNPKPIDYGGVRRLLEDAYAGRRPG
jgi:maleylacetate reductase